MSNTTSTTDATNKSVHAHKILEMMAADNSDEPQHYTTESLIKTLHDTFGANTTYNTCSEKGMNAAEVIEALRLKGKFKPASEAGDNHFTLNSGCSCKHN